MPTTINYQIESYYYAIYLANGANDMQAFLILNEVGSSTNYGAVRHIMIGFFDAAWASSAPIPDDANWVFICAPMGFLPRCLGILQAESPVSLNLTTGGRTFSLNTPAATVGHVSPVAARIARRPSAPARLRVLTAVPPAPPAAVLKRLASQSPRIAASLETIGWTRA